MHQDIKDPKILAMQHKKIHQDVMNWITTCVIGWKLCPFAAQPVIENRMKIHILTEADLPQLLLTVYEQGQHMLHHTSWLNTLIVTPYHWQDFMHFWDAVASVEEYCQDQNWEGMIQVASFHPQYQFAGEVDESVFSNRSPYPIFHLLHEEEMSHVLDHHPQAEDIADHNIQRLRQMGLAHIEEVFRQNQWTQSLRSLHEES